MQRGISTHSGLAVVVTVVVVVSLGSAVPVAMAQQAEEEPNDNRDNATVIEPGEEVTGDLTEDDEDWYALQVEAGETVNLTVDGTNAVDGSFNSQIWDPQNNLIRSDVSNGFDTLGTTMPTGGTAYVRIKESNALVDYSFTVDTERTDWFEPNEDRANASRLYENPLASRTARAGIGDSDWFAFGVAEGDEISATGWSLSENQVGFSVFRPDGSDDHNDVAAGSLTLETTAATDGTALVRAQSHRRTPGSAYNVTVVRDGDRLGLANDRFERSNPPIGNQDPANASEVGSGTYADLAIVDDDRDVFAIELDAGERVNAAIDFTHAENDLALALTDDAGTDVESADSGSDGEELGYTASEAGTYYLTVTGEAGASATYDLDLAVLRLTDVTLGPGGLTAPPDTTTTVNVTVSEASAGLSTTDLTLRSTDTSVLRIESVEAAGTGSVDVDVADNGETATASVSGLDEAARGAVTVAQVTVATAGTGSASLAGSATVTASDGLEYPLGTVQNTSVSVAAGADISTATPDTGDGDGDGGDGGGADGADGGADGTTTTSGGGPGFGVVGALLALVGMALLARRR